MENVKSVSSFDFSKKCLDNGHRILTAIKYHHPNANLLDAWGKWETASELLYNTLEDKKAVGQIQNLIDEAIKLANEAIIKYLEYYFENNKTYFNGKLENYKTQIDSTWDYYKNGKIIPKQIGEHCQNILREMSSDINNKIKEIERLEKTKEELIAIVTLIELEIPKQNCDTRFVPEVLVDEAKRLLKKFPSKYENTIRFIKSMKTFIDDNKNHFYS